MNEKYLSQKNDYHVQYKMNMVKYIIRNTMGASSGFRVKLAEKGHASKFQVSNASEHLPLVLE
jgi:hypothetical protein